MKLSERYLLKLARFRKELRFKRLKASEPRPTEYENRLRRVYREIEQGGPATILELMGVFRFREERTRIYCSRLVSMGLLRKAWRGNVIEYHVARRLTPAR